LGAQRNPIFFEPRLFELCCANSRTNWSKIMLKKEFTDSFMTIMPLVMFIILALYLLFQDTASVGPL
jgi:hypothetical protein